MPDPSLYTILGTLGGAVLGATGAVIGPMVLHRRQARERLAQEARLEQREQEQARREEEWRRRQLQLEVDRDSHRDREALIMRLINMRATTRDFQEYLMKTFRALVEGGDVGLDNFQSGLDAVQASLNSAFDEALLDGLWFAHARQAALLIRSMSELGPTPSHGLLDAMNRKNAGEFDATGLVDWLMEAAHLVRQSVKNGPPIPDDMRTEVEQALLGVATARDALVTYIRGRLDAQGPSH